jgi:hypothetical protein
MKDFFIFIGENEVGVYFQILNKMKICGIIFSNYLNIENEKWTLKLPQQVRL